MSLSALKTQRHNRVMDIVALFRIILSNSLDNIALLNKCINHYLFMNLQWFRRTGPIRYTACYDYLVTQSDPQPNNWLISDRQIAVSEAKRIDITVEYRITSCSVMLV